MAPVIASLSVEMLLHKNAESHSGGGVHSSRQMKSHSLSDQGCDRHVNEVIRSVGRQRHQSVGPLAQQYKLYTRLTVHSRNHSQSHRDPVSVSTFES